MSRTPLLHRNYFRKSGVTRPPCRGLLGHTSMVTVEPAGRAGSYGNQDATSPGSNGHWAAVVSAVATRKPLASSSWVAMADDIPAISPGTSTSVVVVVGAMVVVVGAMVVVVVVVAGVVEVVGNVVLQPPLPPSMARRASSSPPSHTTQEEASVKVHRSRSVRRAEVTTEDRNLVSHAGTALFSELADRTVVSPAACRRGRGRLGRVAQVGRPGAAVCGWELEQERPQRRPLGGYSSAALDNPAPRGCRRPCRPLKTDHTD